MTGNDLSIRLKARLFPRPYDVDISPSEEFDFVIMRKAAVPSGKYAVGFKQLTSEISFDQFLDIRMQARQLTKSMWLFREVGIYLILCGPEEIWRNRTGEIVADKTGLHSIIINAVHFIDPTSQSSHLSTSSWGSIEFGDINLVSEIVEELVKCSNASEVNITSPRGAEGSSGSESSNP